ncbi:hypothetical protein L204_101467 [Cryptococcus depauperatus]|nr:hypothetical protein L204_04138 [Cryptococcus depauperatus CBS 7855]
MEGLPQIETLRKTLLKASPKDLNDGISISQALEIIQSLEENNAHIKLLELLLVILRQLYAVLSLQIPSPKVISMVDELLIPGLQPGKQLAVLIMTNIDHPLKIQQTRAIEALSTAAKLSSLWESNEAKVEHRKSTTVSFIEPLFVSLVQGKLLSKGVMLALIAMLPYISAERVPMSLLDSLLDEVSVAQDASVRCTLAADLLLVACGIQLRSTTSTISLTLEQQDRLLHLLSPCFETSQPPSTLSHLSRYLLPQLLNHLPSLLTPLLSHLGPPNATLKAWVGVASLGVTKGLVTIEQLPHIEIKMVLESEDTDTRLRAFELVTGRKEFTKDGLELIKISLKCNEAITNGGVRSAFSSASFAFFTRLQQYNTGICRILRRISKQPSSDETVNEASNLMNSLSHISEFHSWFLAFIDENICQARRFPVSKVLMGLILLERYLEVLGHDDGVQESVFTLERMQSLLACQASQFTEVRVRSRKIIDCAKVPLPGYESLQTPLSQILLKSALVALDNPRRTQAEAGKAALCILFGWLIKKRDNEQQAVNFVQDLIAKLENALISTESNLVLIEKHPLHGFLSVIKDILVGLELKSPGSQRIWSPIFHRLFQLIKRAWLVTRPVISLATSRLMSVDQDSLEGNVKPDHEIARACEILGAVDDTENEEGMDHTGLLFGCWRATMTAGELLATLISLPIFQAGASQIIWSINDVDSAGQTFLVWLHEIRHRGTFSKISTAFAQLVETVRSVEEMKCLCREWLEHELIVISSDQISTTRRSAALPYSILSIVSSSEQLLERAITCLLDFARVDNEMTSNATKVHALNVLKVVLLDARQTKFFDTHFERSVLTALGAFESSNWNVRNVGLILFSTLVHRCLAPSRGGQDYYRSRAALLLRKSFYLFHSKYPLILPFIIKYLAHDGGEEKANNKHTPLFPILIIVRSLKWSDTNVEIPRKLSNLIEPYLSSTQQQVRQVAAQALGSTLSPVESIQRALSSSYEAPSLNAFHGHLLLLRQLIRNFVDWDSIDEISQSVFEEILQKLLKEHVPGYSPLITAEIVGCVEDYLGCKNQSESREGSLIRELVKRATQHLVSPTKMSMPGEDFRLSACIDALIRHSASPSILLSFLGPASTEISNLHALDYLERMQETLTATLLDRVMSLAITGAGGAAVQEKALNALAEIKWNIDSVNEWKNESNGLSNVCRALHKIISTSTCVSVREAALVALGWVVHLGFVDNIEMVDSGIYGKLAENILQFSHENESQPSRYAAIKALSHLTSHLFRHPKLELHQALLRLTQDDDEEIRQGAANIITLASDVERRVIQQKAHAMWYDWAVGYLLSLTRNSEEWCKWISWLKELSLDQDGYDRDLSILKCESGAEVLFEVEPPNIFRDSFIDASHASKLLSSLKLHEVQHTVTLPELRKSELSNGSHSDSSIKNPETPESQLVSELCGALECLDPGNSLGSWTIGKNISPIDDAWEARRSLLQRLDIRKQLQ